MSFLVIGMSLSVLGPALTDLRERSGSDVGAISVLFVGQSLGYLLGSFIGGALFDRVDGHRVYSAALAALAASLFVMPWFHAVPTMFIVFLVIGASAGIVDVGANTLLMWEMGANGRTAMNVLHMCFGLGAIASPLLVHIGLAAATRVGAIGAIAVAVMALRIPAPRVAAQPREEHTEITRLMLFSLFAFFAAYVGLEVGFAGWIHTYGEEIRFSALAATWLTTVFWIGFIVGRLAASLAADRVDPAAVLLSSCAAAVAAAVLLVLGDGRTLTTWIGTAMMGVAAAPQFPAMMNLAERRVHVTGSAVKWFVAGAGVGGLIFPWLVGRWIDGRGASAFPLAALFFGVATLLTFFGSNRILHQD